MTNKLKILPRRPDAYELLYPWELRRLTNLNGWIPDSIIDTWVEILGQNSPAHVAVVKSTFARKLRLCYEKRASAESEWWHVGVKWSKRWFKYGTTTVILIPVHVTDHWLCVRIDLEAREITVFDSWRPNSLSVPEDWRKHAPHAAILLHLRTWLEHFLETKNEQVDWTLWTMNLDPKSQAFQINGTDCGVYTCFTLALLSRQNGNSDALHKIITPWTVQLYRFSMFVQIQAKYDKEEPFSLPEHAAKLRYENDNNLILIEDSDFSDTSIEVEGPTKVEEDHDLSPLSSLTDLPPTTPPVAPLRRSARKIRHNNM
uniref:Cysteine proteinase n=1 Tax=Mycena chlorophos TaxID=658473 RepID=A0ABQ0L754_MYCCL|nr:cysteine proteinase [Mycena chlorophos]